MKVPATFFLLSIAFVSSKLFPKCSVNATGKVPRATIYTTARDYLNLPTGYRILSSSSVAISLKCSGPFPVQWVFDNDLDAADEVRQTTLYNVREYTTFWNSSTFMHRSFMVLYYTSRVSRTQVFSCQHASNPCVRSMITSKPAHGGFFTDIFRKNESDIPELDLQEETGNSETKSNGSKCDAIFYYGWKNSRWTFCCKAAVDLSAGVAVTYDAKDGSTLENLHRKSPLQSSECVEQVENLTSVCDANSHTSIKTLKGYAIKCGITTTGMDLHHPVIKIRQSISQGTAKPSDIYLNWSSIKAEDMIKFELASPLREFMNKRIEVTCLISRAYFSHGGFIALQDSTKGLIDFKDDIEWGKIDQRYDKYYNAYKVKRVIQIVNTTEALYCFAPVWNATSWVNKSVPVVIMEPQPLKIINLKDKEKIEWNLGDKNRTLHCYVTGMPVEEIKWIFKNKIQNASASKSATSTRSSLHLPVVDKSIEGIYRCLAVNYAGSTEVAIHLLVHDQTAAKIVAGSIIVASAVFITLLVLLLSLWRKNRKQRHTLRLLSPKEIDDFKTGCADEEDYLLAVWKQPYNPEHEIDRHRLVFHESDVLGKGAFGMVYKGNVNVAQRGFPAINLPVAVKTVPKNVHIMYLKALLSELKIMAAISSEKHPNIISLVAACTQNLRQREAYMALEFCSNGSLKHHLKNYRAELNECYKNISWAQQANTFEAKAKILQLTMWACKIADGMNFLASKNIIHGDLAARNVLLDDKFNPKIADFGLARILADPDPVYVKKTQCPLPFKWMAIESLESMNFSVKSDVWSYGILLWEMYSLALTPYPGIFWTPKFVEDLKNGMRCNKPSFAPPDVYQLMEACWKASPMQRISFKGLQDNLTQICEALATSGRKISDVSTETTYLILHEPSFASA